MEPGTAIAKLAEVRKRRGISAAELARSIGLSRQSIYAMEDGSYLPNTAVALRLARALQVQVEDLFHLPESGEPAMEDNLTWLPSGGETPQSRYAHLVQVGERTVAVHVPSSGLYLPAADGMQSANGDALDLTDGAWRSKTRLLVAGCDPALSLLEDRLRTYNIEVITVCVSSRRALQWLKQGLVHVAGTHLLDRSTSEYNVAAVRRVFPKGGTRLVTFAGWQQGLLVRPGNPKGIRNAADLARPDVRIINREKGSGSRDLLDGELRTARVPPSCVRGYESIAEGHLPAAQTVAGGLADCCVGAESAARAYGLDFLPLAQERFDLCFTEAAADLTALGTMLDVLNHGALRRRLQAFAGYSTERSGSAVL